MSHAARCRSAAENGLRAMSEGSIAGAVCTALLVLVCAGAGCQNRNKSADDSKEVSVPMRTIEEVQARYQDEWLALPGVVGVAISNFEGAPCLVVMVVRKTDELSKKIPSHVEGYAVIMDEAGEIEARPRIDK
jgi:hypothetical protein